MIDFGKQTDDVFDLVSNTIPKVSDVEKALTEGVLYLLACKQMNITLDGEFAPLEMLGAIRSKVHGNVSKYVPREIKDKSTKISHKSLITLRDTPDLVRNDVEQGVLQIKVERTAKFGSDHNVLVNHVKKVAWALSIMSKKTTFFTPDITSYPVIKARFKDFPVLPRAEYSADKESIYIFLNGDLMDIARKYMPSAICTKTLDEINADKPEEESLW